MMHVTTDSHQKPDAMAVKNISKQLQSARGPMRQEVLGGIFIKDPYRGTAIGDCDSYFQL